MSKTAYRRGQPVAFRLTDDGDHRGTYRALVPGPDPLPRAYVDTSEFGLVKVPLHRIQAAEPGTPEPVPFSSAFEALYDEYVASGATLSWEQWLLARPADGVRKVCIGCEQPKGDPHKDWCPVVTGTLATLPRRS